MSIEYKIDKIWNWHKTLTHENVEQEREELKKILTEPDSNQPTPLKVDER